MFENTLDSSPQTNIFCGVSAVNWSYYRVKPEVTSSGMVCKHINKCMHLYIRQNLSPPQHHPPPRDPLLRTPPPSAQLPLQLQPPNPRKKARHGSLVRSLDLSQVSLSSAQASSSAFAAAATRKRLQQLQQPLPPALHRLTQALQILRTNNPTTHPCNKTTTRALYPMASVSAPTNRNIKAFTLPSHSHHIPMARHHRTHQIHRMSPPDNRNSGSLYNNLLARRC